MTWVAYAAEVKHEGQWKYSWVLVGISGQTLQDALGAIKTAHKDDCRVRRIMSMDEFTTYAPLMMENGTFMLKDTYYGEDIEFEDGKATLNEIQGESDESPSL